MLKKRGQGLGIGVTKGLVSTKKSWKMPNLNMRMMKLSSPRIRSNLMGARATGLGTQMINARAHGFRTGKQGK